MDAAENDIPLVKTEAALVMAYRLYLDLFS